MLILLPNVPAASSSAAPLWPTDPPSPVPSLTDIANIAVGSELYEEALVIFKKAEVSTVHAQANTDHSLTTTISNSIHRFPLNYARHST